MKCHMHCALPWFKLITPVTLEALAGDYKFKGCQGNFPRFFLKTKKWGLWDRTVALRYEVLASLPNIEEEQEEIISSTGTCIEGSSTASGVIEIVGRAIQRAYPWGSLGPGPFFPLLSLSLLPVSEQLFSVTVLYWDTLLCYKPRNTEASYQWSDLKEQDKGHPHLNCFSKYFSQ